MQQLWFEPSRVDPASSGESLLVHVGGVIDVESAPYLARYVAVLDDRDVELDLTEVSAIDTLGLHVLDAARKHADERGHRVMVRAPGGSTVETG